LKVENFDYPSVNVIAKVDGTDPKLKEEYVLFSGHQDHDGVGPKLTVTLSGTVLMIMHQLR
jgi:hypothetical protein